MSKIDDIIYSYAEVESLDTGTPYSLVQFSYEEVESMMKEYAEWYALKVIDSIREQSYYDDYGVEILNCKDIDNFKLPEHDN